jgi:purine-nucleoside phosphorylase
MIPTPHIEAIKKDAFGKTVLMPGDPLRAKHIAETFLTDVVLINSTRNMLAYTGYYNGKKVSIMGSGMGMPSIGIYSYELFKFYDVENIIRVGSCGAYSPDLDLYDVILVDGAYSESTFARAAFNLKNDILYASKDLNEKLINSAKALNFKLHTGLIHSSDVFYRDDKDFAREIFKKKNCLAVEMESFALFANAIKLNKKAACILTVSDSLVTKKATSALERQTSFNKMIKIALESI